MIGPMEVRKPLPASAMEQRASLRAMIFRRVAVITGVLAFAALLALAAYGVVLIRTDQVANTARGKDTNRAAEAAERGTKRIEDCTTPGRECFERSQQQTAEAVASINRVSILAAACADKPRRQTVEEIQSCVIAGLANQGR